MSSSNSENIDNRSALGLYYDDILQAMKDIRERRKRIPGYLAPEDFREVYHSAYQHAVERLGHLLTAKEIMTREVIAVQEDTPLITVAEKMADACISGVPVVGDEREVVGVISEKDFLSSMGWKGRPTLMGVVEYYLKNEGGIGVSMHAEKAKDIMTSPAITVHEIAPVMEIRSISTIRHINRVPVTSKRNVLVGIVSRADILYQGILRLDH